MYIQFDEDFPAHPKSVRLCAALQHPVAWAYITKLWCWASKYQKDGDLSGYEPAEIEFAVGWTLADGKFYAAAVKVGFIEEESDGEGNVTARRIHNWMKRTGADLRRMAEQAEQKRVFRASKRRPATREAGPSDGQQTDVRDTSCGRPADGDANVDGRSDIDKTRQGKSKQDQVLFPRTDLLEASDPERARSKGGAVVGDLPPPRYARRPTPVGLVTAEFLRVYEAYPRRDAKFKAAEVFGDLAAEHPKGERGLADEILAALPAMLKRHPYNGDNAHRPMLETLLAERRWADAPSAPDDAPAPVEPFAVRAEKERADRALDERAERISAELRPRKPPPNPRAEYARTRQGAGQ